MRIALLADVHANLPALDAVLAHAAAQRVDEYWDLGDTVGYAPFPREVIARLRACCSRQILGNHDPKCAAPSQAERMRDRGSDPDKIFSFEWTCRTLKPADVTYLHSLPSQDVAVAGGRTILLVHGSPAAPQDSLTPRTPAGKFVALLPLVRLSGASIMVCGHTHEFFDHTYEDVRFINPGGVGRSFDGDTRAAYAILDVTAQRVRVEPFRVAYDVALLAAAMQDKGFPPRLIRTFTLARNIEELEYISEKDIPGLRERVAALGRQVQYEEPHALQVRRLAELIFDGVAGYFGLGWRERAWLAAAAQLHDIGWVSGQEGHHKASRDMILKDRTLRLTERERMMVALLARYHRRSLPQEDQRIYKDLNSYDREAVSVLASLLRIADGLDNSHRNAVQAVAVAHDAASWTFHVTPAAGGDIKAELNAAREKADLFARITGQPPVFLCRN